FPAHRPSLEEIGRFVEQEGITSLWLTAGLFHQMVDYQLPALSKVRQLLTGGDILSVAHVQQVLETHSQITLINGYGPTENTTFTTCYPMQHGTELGENVPIGRPISNTQVYVLDEAGQPVPIGVPGELYTGG
ncbi:thioester reductase, partial [Paenibacillus odorifer]